jgi:RNA polymerase sigma-70 factor (ECF subfamily)
MDRVLVERAMAGDHEAFSELTRLSIAKLYATAHLILRDSERAEDATQEALVTAWRRLATLRDPDRFDAWMRRLLVHACYHEAAKARRRLHMESSVRPMTGSSPDPGAALADQDQLARGFARLSPKQRALIVLHYYQGLPLQETADVLGIPVGTVKSRLSRATQQMRAALDADARLPLIEGRVM